MSMIRRYHGICANAGKDVLQDDALDYACKQCGVAFSDPTAPVHDEAKQAFVDWFFSGSWLLQTLVDGEWVT